jgi:DNA-binding PadR family transcriptional regulator
MRPFERFKKSNTRGNLWIYILTLVKEREIPNENIQRLIFEKFGFLPNKLLISRVLFRLGAEKYIKGEKFKGKQAFRTTKKGMAELEKMKNFCQELLETA